MRRSYSFHARGKCQKTSHEIDVVCIFFDDKLPADENDFFNELEVALKSGDTLPDGVVILADKENIQFLQELWNKNPQKKEGFISRGIKNGVQYVKSFYFNEWSSDGVIAQLQEISSGHAFELPVKDFIGEGLYSLIRKNPVVQVAPAGHVFKHPSGTVNRVFIQARELATNEPELSFIGRAMCTQLGVGVLEKAEIVFIDTMSIYPYVKEALSFCKGKAHIQSFHSYSELAKLSPPTEPYAVIISASTTGGMARCLHKEQGFDVEHLLTMVDISSDNRFGCVLIPLDQVSDNYKPFAADGTETEIELVGEHFSSKAKPPRHVTLGEPHRPKALKGFLRAFGIDGIHKLNARPADLPRSKLICLAAEKVLDTEGFREWLEAEVQWNLSVVTKHVIHADDQCSKAIADTIALSIQKARGDALLPTILPAREITKKSLENVQGVLVVTAVVGDGGALREISRDLREYLPPEIPRHFLVGVGLPETTEAWERLIQFLERNPSPRRYKFSAWMMLPIGPEKGDNAWVELANLASIAEETSSITHEKIDKVVISQSLDALSNVVKTATNSFLPKPGGGQLGLTDGMLYFGDVFEKRPLNEISNATTYLTLASVLQTARELKSPLNQLKSSGYESVVLAPENFLRFNDNLLQACLLRAAHPSELDYSASPHLSTLMKEFLLKVFKRHTHSYGDAALEFAAALATGKLKLKEADLCEVVEKSILDLAKRPSALLGFLLMVDLPSK